MPDRISALIIKDKKLLIVTGYDEDIWWTPGGKVDKGEDREIALKREIKEELGVDVKSAKKYHEKLVINSITKKPQQVYFYLVNTTGEIKPHSEITKFHWLSADEAKSNKLKLSNVMTEVLLPMLIQDNIL